MRSLLVLIDGLGDDKIAEWGGKTPFEQARHTNIDKLMSLGVYGEVSICEDDITPESCSCILRLLGVDKKDMPQNRAYLELLANGRDVSEYEMVLRCNLAAVDADNKLVAFNGYGLSAEEMQKAAEACNDILKDVEFIHLSEYRNLLILNKEQSVLECSIKPPHESVGEDITVLLQDIRQKSLSMNYFLQEAEKRLQQFMRNGLHYILYPWGVSARQTLPSFYDLHGLQGGAVCKAEIVRGIAKALGMKTVIPDGATGDVDTDIKAKADATVKLLAKNDFVIAHFNGSDEAGHRYDPSGKAAFIEKIDSDFIGSIMDKVNEPLKILVCGDHVTSSVTGKHDKGMGPVVAAYLNTTAEQADIKNYQDIIKFLMREE